MVTMGTPTDIHLGEILVDEIVLLSSNSGSYGIPVKFSRRTNNTWARHFAENYLKVKYENSEAESNKPPKINILRADKPVMNKPIMLQNENYVYHVDDLYVSSGKVLIKNTTIEHFTVSGRELLDKTIEKTNEYFRASKQKYVDNKAIKHNNSEELLQQLSDIKQHVNTFLSNGTAELVSGTPADYTEE